MDKKKALKILIENSFALSEEVRALLYHKVDQFNDAQVEALGRFLAQEKALALKSVDTKITNLQKVLDNLNQYIEKNNA